MKHNFIINIAFLALFLASCKSETKIESYDSTTFYSFELPSIEYGDEFDKGKNFVINFSFEFDTSKIELIGLPKEVWSVSGRTMLLDLTKAKESAVESLHWQLKFKEDAPQDDYMVKLADVNCTMSGNPVDIEFMFPDGSKSYDYVVSNTPFRQKFKLDIPIPMWVIVLTIVGFLTIISLGVYKWLSRPNGPLGPVVFDERISMINITSGARLSLKGLEVYEFDKEGVVGAKLTPHKRTIKGKKVITARFSADMSTVERIDLVYGDSEERIEGVSLLKHFDRLNITVLGGTKIIFEFQNSRDVR
jgi:hypothetical protein